MSPSSNVLDRLTTVPPPVPSQLGKPYLSTQARVPYPRGPSQGTSVLPVSLPNENGHPAHRRTDPYFSHAISRPAQGGADRGRDPAGEHGQRRPLSAAPQPRVPGSGI